MIRFAIFLNNSDINASGIYCIENLINGKIYIGSAKNFRVRWNSHYASLKSGLHYNRYLQRAWSKYGVDSFMFTVLETCDIKDLKTKEQEYLDRLKPFDYKNGYNLSPTANSIQGTKFPKEIRDKFSKQRRQMFNTEKGNELKKKIAAATRKRMNGPDAAKIKEKIAKACVINNKKPENRKKNSEALRAIYDDPIKRIEMHEKKGNRWFYCHQTGEKFVSMLEAQRKYGLSNIMSILNGKYVQEKGYSFEYCEKDTIITELRPMVPKPPNNIGKPIMCVQTGEISSSIKEMAEKLNLQTGSIHKVLKGEWKHTHGYTFKRLIDGVDTE